MKCDVIFCHILCALRTITFTLMLMIRLPTTQQNKKNNINSFEKFLTNQKNDVIVLLFQFFSDLIAFIYGFHIYA